MNAHVNHDRQPLEGLRQPQEADRAVDPALLSVGHFST